MNNEQLRRWVLTTVVLLFFFVLESSLFPWLISMEWRSRLLVYPKLVLVSIIFISIFTNRRIGVLFGVGFGLLQDVVFYGHMIGVNSFTYAIAAYLAGLLVRPNAAISMFSVMMIQCSAMLLFEISLYGLYRLFSVTGSDFGWMFMNGMLPSILISLFFALALYIPARRWLESPRLERDSDEE